ncbi:hypothetical protein BDY21DRAFT_360452 [Lineolata rhizophorae]|uniref:Uncharacterized protein n=1 Tax=Lineolata rhizophorae TaxID=578093 RepID=A0A6A6PBI4_9PEZI|nr:hypothetical protein BDY21DRAFT_360452 [Lineolata rhizophorae]
MSVGSKDHRQHVAIRHLSICRRRQVVADMLRKSFESRMEPWLPPLPRYYVSPKSKRCKADSRACGQPEREYAGDRRGLKVSLAGWLSIASVAGSPRPHHAQLRRVRTNRSAALALRWRWVRPAAAAEIWKAAPVANDGATMRRSARSRCALSISAARAMPYLPGQAARGDERGGTAARRPFIAQTGSQPFVRAWPRFLASRPASSGGWYRSGARDAVAARRVSSDSSEVLVWRAGVRVVAGAVSVAIKPGGRWTRRDAGSRTGSGSAWTGSGAGVVAAPVYSNPFAVAPIHIHMPSTKSSPDRPNAHKNGAVEFEQKRRATRSGDMLPG